MTISLTVTADDANDLHAQLTAILGGVPLPQSAAQPPQTDPPKATRKKADSASQGTTQSESPDSTQADGTQPPLTTGTTATNDASHSEGDNNAILTYEAYVKPAVLRVSAHPAAQGGGREGVLKLLEQFKVDHASKVPEDQWPALLDAIKLVLEG